MLIDKSRQKLLNAIQYFVTNTRNCGKTKLFKLLYFLDFQHYQSIGRSVTGLDYFAWKMGPVPKTLFSEFDNAKQDMKTAFDISFKGEKKMLVLKPKGEMDLSIFSRRELNIMKSLAAECKDLIADDMIELTHLENSPWHQIYEGEGRKQELIPYSLAIRKGEATEMDMVVNDHEEFIRNYCDSRDSAA